MTASCADPEPTVDLVVKVRPIDQGLKALDDQAPDPKAQLADLLRQTWGIEKRVEPAPTPESIETEPPTDAAAFARLVEQLREDPIEELAVPVHNLAHAHPSVWPQVRETLLAERVASKTQFKRILSLIGGDVPNRYGHFELNWKRNHGYRVKLSEDWFADLQAIPSAKISSPMRKVYRDALLTVALAHAAARIAREEPALAGEVVETLLDLAYATGGTFRDEVGRVITSIGDEAVPHLVRASVEPHHKRDDHPERLRARYALHNLDRLDRLSPAAALSAASLDTRRLRELLEAYGAAKPGDAASHLLDHVDHPDPSVRRAAKQAFLAYVQGPPPRMRVKLVRRLGGAVERRQAQLSYRALATLAIRERVQAELPDALEPECEIRRDDGSYDQRCLEQPERLTAVWFAHLDEARAKARARGLQAALAAFDEDPAAAERELDTLLLGDDLSDDTAPADSADNDASRRELAKFYVRRAATLQAPLAKAERLRKAMRFATPQQAKQLEARALAFEAQAEGLTERGRLMLAQKAVAISPDAVAGLLPDHLPDDLAALASNHPHDASRVPARGQVATPDQAAAVPATKMLWALLLSLATLGALSWLGARRRRSRLA